MANRVFPYLKTTAPTVNDDTGDGYKVGDIWLDTTNDIIYQVIDVTAGAAIWKRKATTTGTLTQNKQLEFDADGNIVASLSDIGGAGGFFDVAVHARQTSDQTGIVTNTSTVVVFPQEDKDTNSYFDGSTGKFLPTSTTHAGTYEVKLHVTISGLADTKSIWVGVRKNGTTYRWLGLVNTGATSITGVGNSIKVYLDGVDDYLEAIVWHSHGSNRDTYSGSSDDMCWIDIVRVSDNDLEGW